MRNSLVSRPTPPSSCKALTRELIFTKTRNDNLFGIKNLNLWGNDLEDLSLLKEMPNLEVISLSVNNIKTLKYFESCFKLQELYLRKNNIQLLNEIEYLVNLPELKVLWLCDNPEVIIKNLPFLAKLDNDVITPSQRQKYAGNNEQNMYENQDNEEMGNSKVMPYEGNFMSVKPKTNNYMNEAEENQRSFQPNQKNILDQKSAWKKGESPLKPSNKGKKALSYEDERLSEMKVSTKASQQPTESVRRTVNPNDRGNEDLRRNYETGKASGIKNDNHPKAIVGTVNDMIHGGNRGTIPQQKIYQEFQGEKHRQKETYSMNPQFMKNSSNFNSQPNNLNQNENFYFENEQQSSVKRQPPNVSPMKQFEVEQEPESASNQKGSSPNIIMAIMSLLDDLEVDGLEIIKRQTEKKLIEKRHLQKVSLGSAGKQYRRQ